MDRRAYLSVLCAGLGGLAGCVANDSGGAPTRSPLRSETPKRTSSSPESDTPTKTTAASDFETPAPGDCTASSPPSPSTSEGLPEPESYPEKPSRIENESVRTFLEEYETAYRHNRQLADVARGDGCLDYLNVYVVESTVKSARNGFAGEVTTRGSFTGTTCPGVTGTDAPTPLPHADFAPESARYYVTERFVVREGRVVECWG